MKKVSFGVRIHLPMPKEQVDPQELSTVTALLAEVLREHEESALARELCDLYRGESLRVTVALGTVSWTDSRSIEVERVLYSVTDESLSGLERPLAQEEARVAQYLSERRPLDTREEVSVTDWLGTPAFRSFANAVGVLDPWEVDLEIELKFPKTAKKLTSEQERKLAAMFNALRADIREVATEVIQKINKKAKIKNLSVNVWCGESDYFGSDVTVAVRLSEPGALQQSELDRVSRALSDALYVELQHYVFDLETWARHERVQEVLRFIEEMNEKNDEGEQECVCEECEAG